jgi:hypothetical protein
LPSSTTPGTHTIYFRSTDKAGNTETTKSITVVVGKTTLTYNGDTNGVYSDAVSLKATLIEVASGLPIQGKTITFTIGTQSTTGTTDSSGIAATSLVLNQPANGPGVTASFAGDSSFQGSSDGKSFTINKETVAITYTGDTFVFTAGPTITTAPIRLSAHLDQLDSALGDLTKAKVTFEVIPAGGSTIVVANIPVSAAGDALTTASVPVGDYSVKVTISVGNTYWTQDPYGDGILDVVLGSNEQRVTGGGWIPDSRSANGKDNFGFTVNYNNQVKSNSWAKGGLSFTSTNTAYFTAKATLSKIDRATGQVISSDGSYTFAVNIKDGDLMNPRTADTFAVTIFDSNGNIWIQLGTAPSPITLGGGNIVVHAK